MATCGYSCLESAYDIAAAQCNYVSQCTCSNVQYQDAWFACLDAFCDASDFEIWNQEAIKLCSYVGVAWPSSAPATQPTATYASVAASTLVSTSVLVIPSTVTSYSGVTSLNFFSQASGSPINNPSASSAATTSTFPIIPSASPFSQPASNGLSTGAIAGISIGVVAIFFFAVLAFLLWHRKHRQQELEAPVTAPIHDGHVEDNMPFEKDSKNLAVATTAAVPVKYPSETLSEPPQPGPNDKLSVSPIDPRYHPPLSPSPAYTEIAGTPAAAEVDSSQSHKQPVEVPRARPGFIEVDSTPLSHNITSPASELEDPSFMFHELPNEQPVHVHPATSAPAQELASSSAAQVPTNIPPEGQWGAGEEAREDPELARMKAEIEQLRAEKEREMRLMNMEARERELSQKIVQMELRASSGGTGGGGGGGGSSSGGAL